jgi:hypothetical protein
MKRFFYLGGIILLIVAVGIFWYLGQNAKQQDNLSRTQTQDQLLRQDQALHSLVGDALRATSTLDELSATDFPSRLSAKQVKTTKSLATSTLREYGLTIASILKPIGELRGNDAAIMVSALDKQDQLQIQTLLDRKILYSSAAIELQRVTVPTELVTIHTKMINNLKIMATLTGNMSQVLQNPLQGLQSAQVYQNYLSLFYTSINEINSYFDRVGVKFNEEEKIKVLLN